MAVAGIKEAMAVAVDGIMDGPAPVLAIQLAAMVAAMVMAVA